MNQFAKVNVKIPYLNNVFKFSGSSVLPAYPGFIVINIPTVGANEISSPKKLNFDFFAFSASRIHFTWTATTDKTSTAILLNSSKHPHAPVWANPL